MTCPGCGAEIASNLSVCNYCGDEVNSYAVDAPDKGLSVDMQIAKWKKKLLLAPQDAESNYQIGCLYLDKKNEPVQAIYFLKESLRISPSSANAQEALARAQKLNREKQAKLKTANEMKAAGNSPKASDNTAPAKVPMDPNVRIIIFWAIVIIVVIAGLTFIHSLNKPH